MFLLFVSDDLPQPEEQEDTDGRRQEHEQDALPAAGITEETESGTLVVHQGEVEQAGNDCDGLMQQQFGLGDIFCQLIQGDGNHAEP